MPASSVNDAPGSSSPAGAVAVIDGWNVSTAIRAAVTSPSLVQMVLSLVGIPATAATSFARGAH